MEESNFFSAREAASILGVSYTLVTKLLRTKRIPSLYTSVTRQSGNVRIKTGILHFSQTLFFGAT